MFRFIAAHNFIPILISFICYRYFSTMNNQPIDYFFAFGASFFCWIFYFIDKIRDNKQQIFSATERHFLSLKNKRIQMITGISLLLLTIYNSHSIPINQLLIFSTMIPISIFYLKLANSASNQYKEIFSSLIIAVALCLIPISLNGTYESLANFPIFYLMILGNMMLLGIIDKDYDRLHGFNSLSVRFKQSKVLKFFMSLLVILLILTLTINKENIWWVTTYCIFYTLLLFFRRKLTSDSLHVLADLIFIFPLFL